MKLQSSFHPLQATEPHQQPLLHLAHHVFPHRLSTFFEVAKVLKELQEVDVLKDPWLRRLFVASEPVQGPAPARGAVWYAQLVRPRLPPGITEAGGEEGRRGRQELGVTEPNLRFLLRFHGNKVNESRFLGVTAGFGPWFKGESASPASERAINSRSAGAPASVASPGR